jgi:hypothetical protein
MISGCASDRVSRNGQGIYVGIKLVSAIIVGIKPPF